MWRMILLAGASVVALATTAADAASFVYTGTVQTYTVTQTGIYVLRAAGAQGGGTPGGLGARVSGKLPLTNGSVLNVIVGGSGGNGGGFSGSGENGGIFGGNGGSSFNGDFGGGGGSFLAASVTDGVLLGGVNSGNGSVSIDLVPAPSSWVMLITGFGGIGAMLRRRQLRTA